MASRRLVVETQLGMVQDLFKVSLRYLVNHRVARALAGIARTLTSVARRQAKCDSAVPLRQTFMHVAKTLKRSGP